jgi:hypothetical protein
MKSTLEKIKAHAEYLIERGAPFSKDELAIIKMATPSGKAFNAGKRNDKHFQQTGK